MENYESIEDLDLSWINEFEKIDDEYNIYYTEELSFIKIHSIYINNDNEIEKITEGKIFLKNPGFLQKEELLSIIKHNSYSNDIKYSLLSILKYNINIEPSNLNNFLRSKDRNIGSFFLQSVKNIDTIKFDKSISMFHDLNDLLIIFYNKGPTPVYQNRLGTRKIYINSNSFKKTKRNIFKDISL